MLIRRSQKKRNAEPAQKQNHRRLVIDPMVNPGSSAHRHQARPKADPTRPHHRMVTLAQSSPGDRPALAHQSKTTTVMLGLTHALCLNVAILQSCCQSSTLCPSTNCLAYSIAVSSSGHTSPIARLIRPSLSMM